MAVSRSSARQFCQAVYDETGGRVGRWVSIAAVGARLNLDADRTIVSADDCEIAGWVRHDRSHLASPQRGQTLPHSVMLSAEGRELVTGSRSVRGGTSTRRQDRG
jgi:hypothetical protein